MVPDWRVRGTRSPGSCAGGCFRHFYALVGAAFVTGKLAALKTRMENFGRRDVAAMLDVHLTTGGLIEGRRVETFLDSLGIAGSIET